MKKPSSPSLFLATAALIAGAYAGLTYLAGLFGVAYSPIQFRISEILTLLSVVTPAAVPGLTLGCFLGNLGSGNLMDLLLGTLATLLASVGGWLLRRVTLRGVPLVSFLLPVITNGLFVGLEIFLFCTDQIIGGFWITALCVAAGEAAVILLLGLPLYLLLRKKAFKGGFLPENNVFRKDT